MLQTLHTHCIFLSIAGIRPFVECGLQAGPGPDLFQQLRRPQIPGVLPDALIAIQDGHVLCPAQLQGHHRRLQNAGSICTHDLTAKGSTAPDALCSLSSSAI